MRILGIRKRHLFKTNVILRSANRKAMNVLGIIPVEIESMSDNKETKVENKTIIYVVEELITTFISKDTLADLNCIPRYFTQSSPR